MSIGSIAISFNGLVLRNIDLADDWTIIFYRAFSFSFSIFLYLIFKYRNDVLKKKTHKKDLLRFKIDLKAYKFCSRYKKPLLGICHGAQFIGYMNNFKFEKKKHVGNHKVFVKYKLF